MTHARTLVLWIALLALAPVSAEAARGRHCKRLCKRFITACVQTNDCAALPTGRARRSCKRSCKHQLLHSCKQGSNACSTTTTTTLTPGPTTTTLPESCPGFTLTCRAATDFSSSIIGLGNRACVEGQGELPNDTTNVTVTINPLDPGQFSMFVSVLGSGNLDYDTSCSGPATPSNGSLTVEQTGSVSGTAGCCATGQSEELSHCRVTIDRVCDQTGEIVGDFEIDAQCDGVPTCSRQIRFLTTQ